MASVTTSKCSCGRCPGSRIERGLKCFSELSGSPSHDRPLRNGYAFASGVTRARGWDLIGKRATKIN